MFRPDDPEPTETHNAPRTFRAYNVGIAKTGSTSMAGIFGRYRSAHEFMFEESTKTIVQYTTGVLAREALREFVLRRDRLGNLEMDSASFSFSYADILVELFPTALFILTIRDCYSWLDSLLNMILLIGPRMPAWMLEYGQKVNGYSFTASMVEPRDTLIRHLPDLIESSLRYWSTANELLLKRLPPERTLILRTDRISTSIDRIACFVGVPETTLLAEQSHLFHAQRKFALLHQVEYGFLADRFDHYCRNLMSEYFPSYSLRDFLTGSPMS